MLHIEVRVKISSKQEKIREVNSEREKINYLLSRIICNSPPTHAQKVTRSPTLLNGFTRYKRNYFYTKCKLGDANVFEQLTHMIHSNLADPARNHTHVLKIKPCMSKGLVFEIIDCKRLIITGIVCLKFIFRWIPVVIMVKLYATA